MRDIDLIKSIKFINIMILIAVTTVFTLNVIPSYGISEYTDMNEDHWAHSYVKTMSEEGIVKGYEDGSFRPAKQVTYGEFIKMVYIAVTGEELEQPEELHWALNYYLNSIKIGLFDENDIKADQLDIVIPRRIMALIVANSLYEPVINAGDILLAINDVDEETEYWREIAVSYGSSILNGYPDGSFKPDEGLSRAEAAKAVYGIVGKLSVIEKPVIKLEEKDIVNRNYKVQTYETYLGYKGINSFVYSPESQCIGVYSDSIQDISLFVDGKKAMPVSNKEGLYWKEGESYVYVFEVGGMFNTASKVGLAFGLYIEEVFYYKDAFI